MLYRVSGTGSSFCIYFKGGVTVAYRLMKGNEAAVIGALLGGCTHFFGYPITPASEIAQGAAYWFPLSGRMFMQSESEVSVINMVYGAASAGARAMTASSGPGIALMSEGISYLAGARLPAVIIDMQRSGPGLGNIWPEQSDYNMVVKGGGHGDYRNIVFTPYSGQEMLEMTRDAFEIADTYRMTVFILSDAYIGQMMEQVSIDGPVLHGKRKDWAVYGDAQSRNNLITSIHMNTHLQKEHNDLLQSVYKQVSADLVDYETIDTDDADIVMVAYGICARIGLSAIRVLREQGVKAGLFRPKTVWPFPACAIGDLAARKTKLLVVELSNGMMADDVELAVKGRTEVARFGMVGGVTPKVEELVQAVTDMIRGGRDA